MRARFYAGWRSAVSRPRGRTVYAAKAIGKRRSAVNFTVPIVIMILCIGIAALIYWGGFAEERRGRSR
jgi:hypothetical protein